MTSALQATADSGIRSIFAYCIPFRLDQWDATSAIASHDFLPDWAMKQLGDLAGKYNRDTANLIEIGLGFDSWFLPKDLVMGTLQSLRKSGIRVVTTHTSRNAFFSKLPSILPARG